MCVCVCVCVCVGEGGGLEHLLPRSKHISPAQPQRALGPSSHEQQQQQGHGLWQTMSISLHFIIIIIIIISSSSSSSTGITCSLTHGAQVTIALRRGGARGKGEV